MRKMNSMMMLKPRAKKIVLNFHINKVSSVLCLQLVNISLTFSILCITILMLQFNSLHLQLYACYDCCIRLFIYTYVVQVIYGRTRIQFWMRQWQTKEAWSTLHTRAPPTTTTALVSTTPTTATISTPFDHPPHTQEFVIIPNFRYVELRPQPSFPFSLLHLHPNLQEVRLAPYLYLVPLLPLP